jgi:hypothetical protein
MKKTVIKETTEAHDLAVNLHPFLMHPSTAKCEKFMNARWVWG